MAMGFLLPIRNGSLRSFRELPNCNLFSDAVSEAASYDLPGGNANGTA